MAINIKGEGIMERIEVIEYLEKNKDFLFPNSKYSSIELEDLIVNSPGVLPNNLSFRNPSTVLLISVFIGSLGIDRFYTGDVLKGILKYFTFGGFGIWWLIDIVNAKKRCRAFNCKMLIDAINDPNISVNMQRNEEKYKSVREAGKTAFEVGKVVVKGVNDIINDDIN